MNQESFSMPKLVESVGKLKGSRNVLVVCSWSLSHAIEKAIDSLYGPPNGGVEVSSPVANRGITIRHLPLAKLPDGLEDYWEVLRLD